MTTYRYTGTEMYLVDGYVEHIYNGDTNLEFTTQPGNDTFKYGSKSGYFQTDAVTTRLNGGNIDAYESYDIFISDITWRKQNANGSFATQTTTVIEVFIYDREDVTYGNVDLYYMFEVDGDPLPDLYSLYDLQDYYDSITSVETPCGFPEG